MLVLLLLLLLLMLLFAGGFVDAVAVLVDNAALASVAFVFAILTMLVIIVTYVIWRLMLLLYVLLLLLLLLLFLLMLRFIVIIGRNYLQELSVRTYCSVIVGPCVPVCLVKEPSVYQIPCTTGPSPLHKSIEICSL